MHRFCFTLSFIFLGARLLFCQSIQSLPIYYPGQVKYDADWLVSLSSQQAALYRTPNGELVFTNGLVSRTFKLSPNAACIGFENLTTGESLLRSIRPEAEIVVEGKVIKIGGLAGQTIHNYLLPEWIPRLQNDPESMLLDTVTWGPIKERFAWKKRREWMPKDIAWPAPGLELVFHFKVDDKNHPAYKLNVSVHYECYDHLPLISKWIAVLNDSGKPVTLNSFKSEILATTEPQSSVGEPSQWLLPNITVETDYAFGGSMSAESCIGKSVFWLKDSLYLTQVNYNRTTPCLLECKPVIGPELMIMPGGRFESFRTWELVHDTWDRERAGLAKKRMYRAIAPWVTENPVLMHVRQADDESVKKAVEQCAEAGFEMVIMTFGSGFDLEEHSNENLARMKDLADYAHQKGLAIGGYSLLASRSIDAANDVVMPQGFQPTFGHSPCLESNWGNTYFERLYQFYKITGQDVLEHDGSYPGDACASTVHPGHQGWGDSQWRQFEKISRFYRWCRSQGIYLNVPDWYFLNGSNKTGMGYRETNWSLPRAHQEIIERQNIYDGVWEKTPSMGWMFVPLVQYHGGGEEATIEPLKQHLPHYEQRLANLFGAGVQACYRGPQLYDTPATKEVVEKWVTFYKKYRQILDADIVHVRRPDGRDYDAVLHVDPFGKNKGLLMVYNPLTEPIKRTLKVNLYYTGLKDKAIIKEQDEQEKTILLDRDYNVMIETEIPAKSQTWFLIN